MFGIAKALTQGRRDRKAVKSLYEIVTVQSLDPWFYSEIGIDSGFTGRFDVAALHAHILLERLRSDANIPAGFSQKLFECFMGNWDFALRESGVGDMSMHKHIKRVTQGFFGRARAYAEALAVEGDRERRAAIGEALKRNLNIGQMHDAEMRRLVSYVAGLQSCLQQQSSDDLRAGRLELGKPADLAQSGADALPNDDLSRDQANGKDMNGEHSEQGNTQ